MGNQEENQPTYPLVVDDNVYALSANGRILAVFQNGFDAEHIRQELLAQRDDAAQMIVIKMPVHPNLDDSRQFEPFEIQRRGLKFNEQFADYDLDAFNQALNESFQEQAIKQHRRHYSFEALLIYAGIVMLTVILASGLRFGISLSKSWVLGLSNVLALVAYVALIAMLPFNNWLVKHHMKKWKAENFANNDENQ